MFQDNLGIAKNILSDRLSALVENGVMIRVQSRPDTERYTYELTDKGHDLLPVLVALMQWGDRWVFGDQGPPLKVLDAKMKRPIARIAVTDLDGQTLGIQDIRFRPGAGATSETLERFTAARSRKKKDGT